LNVAEAAAGTEVVAAAVVAVAEGVTS